MAKCCSMWSRWSGDGSLGSGRDVLSKQRHSLHHQGCQAFFDVTPDHMRPDALHLLDSKPGHRFVDTKLYK